MTTRKQKAGAKKGSQARQRKAATLLPERPEKKKAWKPNRPKSTQRKLFVPEGYYLANVVPAWVFDKDRPRLRLQVTLVEGPLRDDEPLAAEGTENRILISFRNRRSLHRGQFPDAYFEVPIPSWVRPAGEQRPIEKLPAPATPTAEKPTCSTCPHFWHRILSTKGRCCWPATAAWVESTREGEPTSLPITQAEAWCRAHPCSMEKEHVESRKKEIEQPACATCPYHMDRADSKTLVYCCWPKLGADVMYAQPPADRQRFPLNWPSMEKTFFCGGNPSIAGNQPAGSPVAPAPVEGGKKDPGRPGPQIECSLCGEVIEGDMRKTQYADNVCKRCSGAVFDFLDTIDYPDAAAAADLLIRLLALAGHKARVRVRQHEQRMHQKDLEAMDGGDRLGVPKEKS